MHSLIEQTTFDETQHPMQHTVWVSWINRVNKMEPVTSSSVETGQCHKINNKTD